MKKHVNTLEEMTNKMSYQYYYNKSGLMEYLKMSQYRFSASNEHVG